VSLLVATSPADVPRLEQAGLDPGVLAFALASRIRDVKQHWEVHGDPAASQ